MDFRCPSEFDHALDTLTIKLSSVHTVTDLLFSVIIYYEREINLSVRKFFSPVFANSGCANCDFFGTKIRSKMIPQTR